MRLGMEEVMSPSDRRAGTPNGRSERSPNSPERAQSARAGRDPRPARSSGTSSNARRDSAAARGGSPAAADRRLAAREVGGPRRSGSQPQSDTRGSGSGGTQGHAGSRNRSDSGGSSRQGDSRRTSPGASAGEPQDGFAMDPRRLLGVPRGLDHPLVGPLPGDGLTLAVLVLKRAPLVARVRALRGKAGCAGRHRVRPVAERIAF